MIREEIQNYGNDVRLNCNCLLRTIVSIDFLKRGIYAGADDGEMAAFIAGI